MQVKQGAYFISVYNVRLSRRCAAFWRVADMQVVQAWEPPTQQAGGGARLDTQAQEMNYRVTTRLSARALPTGRTLAVLAHAVFSRARRVTNIRGALAPAQDRALHRSLCSPFGVGWHEADH